MTSANAARDVPPVRRNAAMVEPAIEEQREVEDVVRLLKLLREDLATHDGDWSEPGFLAIAVHRVGTGVRAWRAGPHRAVAQKVVRVFETGVDWIWGIRIERNVRLGRRVRIWHHGCIWIDAREVGDDVHLRQNTTIGRQTHDKPSLDALPKILNGVDVGSGVSILGGITVGARATIGANTVVTKDVPDGATVLGVPGRIVPS